MIEFNIDNNTDTITIKTTETLPSLEGWEVEGGYLMNIGDFIEMADWELVLASGVPLPPHAGEED